MRNDPRLVALIVACGATAANGCVTSKECGSKACSTPIIVTAPLTGAAPGVHTATFCKQGHCESAHLDLSVPSEATVDGLFFVRFQGDLMDHGITITASVLGAPSFEDGESLSFTVTSDSSEDVVLWSETATYQVIHDINGPGCGDCYSLRATVAP